MVATVRRNHLKNIYVGQEKSPYTPGNGRAVTWLEFPLSCYLAGEQTHLTEFDRLFAWFDVKEACRVK